MNYYATYFDTNYLSRGLALHSSLVQHSTEEFKLYILCLDDEVWKYFSNTPQKTIELISLAEIENYYSTLSAAKSNRSLIEYYFTISPFLPLYLLCNYPEIQRITTMDADMYFHSDPGQILKSYPDASVLISPHNFSPGLEHLAVFGKYNVSFQSFKNDLSGLACLNDWAKKCLAWCHDYHDLENKRFADQLYLDKWDMQFSGVQEISMAGAGLAPWNIAGLKLELINGKYFVNGQALISYHFHHLRKMSGHMALHGLEYYGVDTTNRAIRRLYLDYLNLLSGFEQKDFAGDKNVIRANSTAKLSLLRKLRHPEGYWLFSSSKITHFNPEKRYRRFKTSLKALWQS